VVALFSHGDRHYEPLEPVEVRYEVEGFDDEPPRAVEHSVLWFTEGKGEEEVACTVHSMLIVLHVQQ
jgi:hypothetical protein